MGMSADAAARSKRSSWSPSVSQEAKENQAGEYMYVMRSTGLALSASKPLLADKRNGLCFPGR